MSSHMIMLREILNDLSHPTPTGTRQKKTTDERLYAMRDSLVQSDVLMLIYWEAQKKKVKNAALSKLHKYVTQVARQLEKYDALIDMLVASEERALECKKLGKDLALIEVQQVRDHFASVSNSSKYWNSETLKMREREFDALLCVLIGDAVPNHRIVMSASASGLL